MKTTMIIFFSLFQFMSYGNDTTYYSVMRKAIIQMESAYTYENFLQMANTSERVISSKPKEWVPLYYKAYAYVNMGHLNSDEDKKDKCLDIAQETLEKAYKLNPNESELYVLNAYLYYCRMEINPMLRGMIYSPKANEMLTEAEELNNKNPRVYYLKASSLIYTPEFMGGGKEAAKPFNERALKLFKEYKPICDICPDWGESGALDLQKKLEN